MRGEIATKPIVWVAVAIGGTVVLAMGVVFLLLRLWQTPPGSDRVPRPNTVVAPAPQLQSSPQLDLGAYREEKRRVLDSAAWVDAQHGIARIPIADAMALLAASAARGAQR
jgi:hypothetical protein